MQFSQFEFIVNKTLKNVVISQFNIIFLWNKIAAAEKLMPSKKAFCFFNVK